MDIDRSWPEAKASGFFIGTLHEPAKSAILAKSADLAKFETAMKTYTLTDLGNKSGEVVEAAHDGPVDITSRGRRKYVLMTAERYDRLAGRTTQKAYSINTMTEAEVDELLAGLDALIEQAEKDDE